MDKKDIEEKFACILKEGCGFDLTDPNLIDTPKRMANMFREVFYGHNCEFDDYKSFPNEDKYDQIILFDNLNFTSWCSHHMLPFSGTAWVLYIPGSTLIGASKPARALAHFSARPQLQERLCHQLLHSIVEETEPEGAMVFMRATHTCMTCRGVRQSPSCGMTTSAVHGKFKNMEMELKGLKLIELSLKLKG